MPGGIVCTRGVIRRWQPVTLVPTKTEAPRVNSSSIAGKGKYLAGGGKRSTRLKQRRGSSTTSGTLSQRYGKNWKLHISAWDSEGRWTGKRAPFAPPIKSTDGRDSIWQDGSNS